jgi:hypothetical protein
MPALVDPESGIILAIGIGTQYGLRLPRPFGINAIKAGAKTVTTWSTGGSMDIQRELGDDWIFGAWLPDEVIWCKKVIEMF